MLRRVLSAIALAPLGHAQCELTPLLSADLEAGDRFGVGVSIDGDVALVGAPYDDDGASNAGAAYVFRWTGAGWVQEQKLLAGDLDPNDHFGEAVAIRGSIAVVGMEDDDVVVHGAGSIYVFRFDGAAWVLEQKIRNPDSTGSPERGRRPRSCPRSPA